jgi:hypothetical protein
MPEEPKKLYRRCGRCGGVGGSLLGEHAAGGVEAELLVAISI